VNVSRTGFTFLVAAWALFLTGCPGGDEVEALLQEGSRLQADGLHAEAEAIFRKVLEEDEENEEARLRLALSSFHSGQLDKQALRNRVMGTDEASVPPGFKDLMMAELAAIGGDDGAYTRFLENALGRSGDRLRFDLHHRLDHSHGFAATERFCCCFTIRVPSLISKKEKASREELAAGQSLHLFRLIFRPSETAYLTVISWSPTGGAKVVFPDEGSEQGGPFDGGSRALLQVTHPRQNRWVALPSEPESCLFALATPGIPDRDRLVEILAKTADMPHGGPEKTKAELEQVHGIGSALFHFYEKEP